MLERYWITDRLKDLRKSQRALSAHLNLDPAQTNRMISGRRDVQVVEVIPLSEFLELPSSMVLERLTGRALEPAAKIRAVEAFLERYRDLPEELFVDFLDKLSHLIDAQLQHTSPRTKTVEEHPKR